VQAVEFGVVYAYPLLDDRHHLEQQYLGLGRRAQVGHCVCQPGCVNAACSLRHSLAGHAPAKPFLCLVENAPPEAHDAGADLDQAHSFKTTPHLIIWGDHTLFPPLIFRIVKKLVKKTKGDNHF
jgi:hypothetical protein